MVGAAGRGRGLDGGIEPIRMEGAGCTVALPLRCCALAAPAGDAACVREAVADEPIGVGRAARPGSWHAVCTTQA
jgi:hypothetical protein